MPWWQLHLCDRRRKQGCRPPALERPESRTNYRSTLRGLCANGLPDAALRLLKQHSGARRRRELRGQQAMLERLETLLELMPRAAGPELLQPQGEDAPLGQLEQAALRDFKLQHHVWSSDLAALARDAAAAPPTMRGGAGAAAYEVQQTALLLSGDGEALRRASPTPRPAAAAAAAAARRRRRRRRGTPA